jgi:hypothetical protein
MVVGRGRVLLVARTLKLSATTIGIGHKRCRVPVATALAGLVASPLKLRVTDAAGCDPASMFVTRVGPDTNHGFSGWQYKIGHASPSRGAGEAAGRLRSGQQLLWFWCVRAGACERTLAVTYAAGRFKVIGYDDNGHGKAIAGATIHVDNLTATTGSDGTAVLILAAAKHTVYATKTGLVQSFPLSFTAGP